MESDEAATGSAPATDLDFDPADPEQLIAAFKARYPFELDDFQEVAIRQLAAGDSVMVAAPTSQKRAFTSDEVTLMQALAAEAALALERTRSAGACPSAGVRSWPAMAGSASTAAPLP